MKFTLTLTPTFDVHTVVINHNCCVEKLSNDRFVDYIIKDEISSLLDYGYNDDEWSINDDDKNRIRQALIDECYRLGRIKNDDPLFMM